ncbi:Serine/threonine-protein kinase PknD [Streptomyces rimosus subsp. rimosus]
MGSFGGEGRLIAGRYRLGERLGRGGMGTVWRATDELLARQVAVKVLHVDEEPGERGGVTRAGGPDAAAQRERAVREARTVARIRHPNVIVVHDVVEQDGRAWIVMELVDGQSLADRLIGGGPLAPREVARIGLALLGALRASHTLGVLHRDIKPANVLLEEGTGRVVLTDFGVAKVSGSTTLTESGGFVGSPEYTAPERMAGRPAGPAADLWSVGVLLCAALSGETPFRRDSLGGVLSAVMDDEIELSEPARPSWPSSAASWNAIRPGAWTSSPPSVCCAATSSRAAPPRRRRLRHPPPNARRPPRNRAVRTASRYRTP